MGRVDIKVPIGAISGTKILSGTGPNINIKVMPVGSIDTEIKTEFESKGINQTVYRIYLNLICEIKIIMPYESISRKIENQILLVETGIVGDVPETYYNLEGINGEDTLQLIHKSFLNRSIKITTK